VDFHWTELRDVIAKIEEELRELKGALAEWHRHPADNPSPTRGSRAGIPCQEVKDETGDLLFAVVNLARKCGFDAESALQSATDKFVARFDQLEDELRARGKRFGEADLAEMNEIWNKVKNNEA
jgi:uncharacterized protein YabN with tetrapyrrole methylase and pyrophosphatase domain